MSDPRIRQALLARLAALMPALPTAFQNEEFTPPVDGGPYQEAFILPAATRTVGLSQRTATRRGIFQINLCYPVGLGAGEAEQRGRIIGEHFDPASTVLSAGGVVVRIAGKPVIGEPVPGRAGRYVVPVSVRYESTF